MAKVKTYEIQTAVRGTTRLSGEAITYDLKPGTITATEVHPVVLDRLINDGIAVEKKGTAK